LAWLRTGKMQRESRPADAALLIEEQDDHGWLPRSEAASSRPFPRRMLAAEEDLDSALESLSIGDLLSVQSLDGDPYARSPDIDAPEIPISFAPEIPISTGETHSFPTAPVERLGRMTMSSRRSSWRSSANA
jgi:hypothetical protein